MGDMRLIIFDLDGTLVDSIPDLTDAANHFLTASGREPLTQAQLRKLVGQGARNLVERALVDAHPDEVERCLKMFLAYNEEHIAVKTALYAGVRETLEELRRQGIMMAVISNKNVALCRKLLAALQIDAFFEEIMGADSLPFRKPSPEPVLKMLDDLRVSAGEAMIVGDSINDIAAGKGAGIVTVACTFGYGDSAETDQADWRIDTFAELLQLPLLKKNEKNNGIFSKV